MASSIASQSSTVGFKTLSLEALEILRLRGDTAQLTHGTRSVSNTSYLTAASYDSEETVLIPDELESLETLCFLELNESTALKVYEQFLQRKSDQPHRASTLSSAKRWVAAIAVHIDDDWVIAMQRIGLSSDFQARLMDPRYTDMRLSGTLKEWVYMMMEERYLFLESLDDVVKASSTPTFNRKISTLDLHGKIKITSAPEVPPRSSSKPPAGNFKPNTPAVATKSADPPPQLPGHTMLFKGATLVRLEAVTKTPNQLNFQSLGSTPPGDFDAQFRGLYLTRNEEAAWWYAQWARVVVDGRVVPVGILRVAVPTALLASSFELYDDIWRRYVWACRRTAGGAAEFDFLQEYQWLIGPLCKQSNDVVARLTDKSGLELWELAGTTVSQHYASNNAILRLLNEHCVGKVWVSTVATQGEGKSV